MSYSTPAMVRKALVPSSDGALPENPTHTAADFSDAELLDAIAEADSIIDGYIGGYYSTPVAPTGTPSATPHPIDYWSRNIAAYNATLTFRGSMDFSDQDPVARRFTATMEALNAVASNKMVLQIPANTSDTAGAGVAPAYNPYTGTLWTTDDFDLRPVAPRGPSPFWGQF